MSDQKSWRFAVAAPHGSRRREWLVRLLCTVAITAVPSAALAQTSDGSASSEIDYPDLLVERPLVLPVGLIEVAVKLSSPMASSIDTERDEEIDLDLFDVLLVDLSGRLGLGSFDARVGVGLVARDTLIPMEFRSRQGLLSVEAGGQLRVIREAAIGLDILFYDTTTELEGTFRYKRRLGRRFAARVDGGFELWRDARTEEESLWLVSFTAKAGGQMQVARSLAAYGGLDLTAPLLQRPSYDPNSFVYMQVGTQLDAVAGLAAHVTGRFDVYAELEWLGSDIGQWGVSVGVLMRNDP